MEPLWFYKGRPAYSRTKGKQMNKTKIEWTHFVWNPVVGCSKVSAGCDNCYAERFARRLKAMGLEKYQGAIGPDGRWSGKPAYADVYELDAPRRWKTPRRVFVCSMGDLFHENVPFGIIARVFDAAAKCAGRTGSIFQFLTKRPKRLLEFYEWMNEDGPPDAELPRYLWFGVTCEDQTSANARIKLLARVPAQVRFVSFEPLLGPVELSPEQWQSLDWIIIGCESGPGRRPCKGEWVESLIHQADERDVPVFVKQLEVNWRVSKNPEEWPLWARRREYPETR